MPISQKVSSTLAATRFSPHAFSLRQLQYAVAVADTLSFRKAAERCHVSQPSLSSQLAQLEALLGVRLFERDRRGVLPTHAGRELVERARILLREADDLLEVAKRQSDPLAGELRIGIIPTISPYLLPHLTPALRAAFPKLTAFWVEDRTATLMHALDGGALDAALLALEAELGDVEHALIARDRFLLAAPSRHPLAARRGPAKPEELHAQSVLLLDDGHCLRAQALSFCTRARAEELEFRATSLPTLVQMVAAGAGVTLLPELSIETETRRADLTLRAFKRPEPHRTIALVWRKRAARAAALREVAKVIRAAYPKPAPRKP